MSLSLIEAMPKGTRVVPYGSEPILAVSEFFTKTVQGEGVYTGHPATFLRLQGCTLRCSWCDTIEVWEQGNEYIISELFKMLEEEGIIDLFSDGMHLVLTGGSPLMQQEPLEAFVRAFLKRYGFKPFIEVENECVLKPTTSFSSVVDCWNNSPKLKSSNNPPPNKGLLKHMASLPNSWFKFVVDHPKQWGEIEELIKLGVILKSQVILMPLGATKEELMLSNVIAAEMAVTHNVKYSTREHIMLWGKKTGV